MLLITVILLPALVVNDVGMGDPFFCKYICPQGVLEGAIPLAAVDQGIRSVAFPSISTGAYSFPKEKAAMIAVRTVNDFIEENSGSLDLVEWILFDEETLNIYKDALNQFKANKIVGTHGF